MAVEILGVTNAGLKCGSITVPIIKVVVADVTSANVSPENYETIYSRAVGSVTMVALASSDATTEIKNAVKALTAELGRNNKTYGDNTGFRLTFSVQEYNVISMDLSYKGNLVSRTSVITGVATGTLECSHAVIFVDRYNNVYKLGSESSINLFYDINPGLYNSGGIPVAPLLSGYTIKRRGVGITKTVYNITPDITNEREPGGEEDPYEPGGETGPGGGGGDFDGTSEDIDFPDDPTLSAVDTGFLTLFNPSLSQLNDLANFMWGSIFDIENWKKLFANPMDAILGLSMVPVAVPNGGTSSVKVGNIDTGVAMTKAARQYVNVDCGAINVKEYWGAYLDYSPYTKAEVFLPFIGTHELSVDDIMGKTVHIKYKVDILSGACVANIKCGGSVLYSYSGQCAATIPITGRDWTQTLSAALSVAGNVLSIAASQGMTAPMAATNIAQSAVNAIKPNIQKTGNIGGMAGIMGIQKPYIILTRPRQAMPKNQNKYTGYPSFITAKLSKCGGYTEVEKIHLDSTSATQDEIREIETLLDKGVIF